MQELFSTDKAREKDRFPLWRDVCEDRLVPMAQRRLDDGPFNALIEGVNIGGIDFTKFSLQNVHASTTHQTIKHHHNDTDQLFVSLVVGGSVAATQNGLSSISQVGDFSIRDTNSPWEIEHNAYSEVIAIGLPRKRLESLLGDTRHFAGLRVEGHRPAAILARSFIINLIQVGGNLPPQSADRMRDISIDLIIASLSERMAIDAPKHLCNTLILQRALDYIMVNLHDRNLNSDRVAVAAGASLRKLQILFHKDGKNIADWIRQKRLEMAEQRLSDHSCS